MKKYPLTKRSGIDNKVYSQRADNRKFLRINDKQVFDSKPAFKLSSHDTHKTIIHIKTSRNKKGKN